jgi:hypothetical protein
MKFCLDQSNTIKATGSTTVACWECFLGYFAVIEFHFTKEQQRSTSHWTDAGTDAVCLNDDVLFDISMTHFGKFFNNFRHQCLVSVTRALRFD